jgi:hypothetical protein
VCQSCGTTEGDWVDVATGRPHDVPKWEATSYRCPGCAEVARVSASVPDGEAGVRVVLIPFQDNDDDNDD